MTSALLNEIVGILSGLFPIGFSGDGGEPGSKVCDVGSKRWPGELGPLPKALNRFHAQLIGIEISLQVAEPQILLK